MTQAPARPSFPAGALRLLRCPVCHEPLDAPSPSLLRCAAGHAFDVARQGYVHLSAGRPPASPGDTPAMVAARERFLAAGRYAPLADRLAAAAADALGADPDRGVLDVGAGTGHYAARVLERCPGAAGVAIDVSRAAARRAARAHPRLGSVVAAAEALPVRDGAIDLALSVLAPRAGAELARVLAPGGALLVGMPTPRHLRELVEPLGLLRVDADKDARLDARLTPWLARVDETELDFDLRLGRAEALDLVAMGPSAFHVPLPELARRVARLAEPVAVSASFRVLRFRHA